MSIGGGSDSSSPTNKSAQQTTGYGEGTTLSVGAGRDLERVDIENVSEDIAMASLDFAGEANERVSKNFSELVNYAEQESVRDDQMLAASLETVQTIAADKATGQQRSQRMATYAIAGIVLVALVFSGGPRKKAT